MSYASATGLDLLPPPGCDVSQLEAALNRLAQSAPQIKKNVLTASVQTVAADGMTRESEAELWRAIADTLDCPLPPLLR